MLQPRQAAVLQKQRHNKRNLVLLIFSVVLFLTSLFLAKILIHDYSFTGDTFYSDGTHLFLAEARPHNMPEETAYNYFLYNVKNDIDKKYSLLPDSEQNKKDKESVKQDKSSHYNRHDELYTNYVLQAISTVDKNRIDQSDYPSSKYQGEENDPKYKYYNLNKTVADLGLKEYEVINVVFTQKYSDKLLALGPQWGDGTFSQDMLVGKSSTDQDYKIYEMGPLITYTNAIFPNDGMAFLAGNFTINISESNSGNKKSVTDLQQKYNTLMLLAGGKETPKTSVNDVPSLPNYMCVDIYFDSDDSSDDYYVYSENNKYYIEKAYSFIHEITKSDYEQLTGILTENSGSSSTLSSSVNTSDISELDSFVDEKLQIILSSPKTSSNPQDYISAHKPEYQQIVAQGKSVLPYLFKPFEHGINYDLRSQVIKYICVDIIGPTEKSPYPASVPQIWYNTAEMKAEYVLPDYKYEGSDLLLKQIYDTLSGNNFMPNNGFKVYAVHVFGSYEEGNKVKVFFAQSGTSYILCGTSLFDKSGGSGTAIFTYTKNADGSYTLDPPPQDNGDYDHNIDNLCTMPISGKKIEHLADQIKSYDFKEVINLQQQNLINHLKKYGHTGVTYYTTNGESVPLT